MLVGCRKTKADRPQQSSVGQSRPATVSCRPPLHNSPRNAGETISGDSAPHPEPEEIQNADQRRHQRVHMTKTIRSDGRCLFRLIASMQLHVQRLCLTGSAVAARNSFAYSAVATKSVQSSRETLHSRMVAMASSSIRRAIKLVETRLPCGTSFRAMGKWAS